MNYELVSVLREETENWKSQKERALANNSRVITLLPDPFLARKQKEEYENTINVVDVVTGRTFDDSQSLFFDKAPVADGSEIFMEADGKISIIKNGVRIGMMRIFPGTRRLVQDITYFNEDGTRELVEEYALDGKLFSNIFFFKDEIQEINFMDDNENVRLRFYFYEGNMNLITVIDPETSLEVEKYDNMEQFQASQVAKIVKPDDKVGITYLGMELTALSQTRSENTLYMEEPAFDGDQVKGNLMHIMNGEINYVQHVVVEPSDYLKMIDKRLKISKVAPKGS